MDNLEELIYSIIGTFLGPNKGNKFLIQDKDICVVRCPLYILQNVRLQDPITVLVEETLFAHHELYGCSSLSLLAMWHFWKKEFTLAMEEGCDMQNIIHVSQNMLELAISALPAIAVSVDKILVSKNCPKMIAGQRSIKKVNGSNQVPLSIRYSSRHFSPSSHSLSSDIEDQNGQGSYRGPEVDEENLRQVVQSLNHSENAQISELVSECCKKQLASARCTKFQSESVHVFPVVLPHCSSTVVDGLVVKSNLNCTQYQDVKKGHSNRVLMIMGSISHQYVHLGFAPKVSVQRSSSAVIPEEEQWRRSCCDLILQLNVNILLVKDDVDEEITSFCSAHGVRVFPHIPLKVFKALCSALHCSPCTYLWDCKEENVVKSLVIREWNPSLHSDGSEQYFVFGVCFENNFPLQTLVICHPSPAVLEMLEHEAQHLMSRLSLALQNGCVLPGGAEAEKSCIDCLRKHEFQNASGSAARIVTALTNGFRSYRSVVSGKRVHLAAGATKPLDEMSSKVNAWRSALSLTLLTLQCDSAIVNGLGDL